MPRSGRQPTAMTQALRREAAVIRRIHGASPSSSVWTARPAPFRVPRASSAIRAQNLAPTTSWSSAQLVWVAFRPRVPVLLPQSNSAQQMTTTVRQGRALMLMMMMASQPRHLHPGRVQHPRHYRPPCRLLSHQARLLRLHHRCHRRYKQCVAANPTQHCVERSRRPFACSLSRSRKCALGSAERAAATERPIPQTATQIGAATTAPGGSAPQPAVPATPPSPAEARNRRVRQHHLRLPRPLRRWRR